MNSSKNNMTAAAMLNQIGQWRYDDDDDVLREFKNEIAAIEVKAGGHPDRIRGEIQALYEEIKGAL